MKEYFVTLKVVTGHIAMWATRHSFYVAPDNLESVLSKFYETAKQEFVADFCDCFVKILTEQELIILLETHLLSQEQVIKWSCSDNFNSKKAVVVCQYRNQSFYNNAVNFDALVKDIAQSVIQECVRYEMKNQKIEVVFLKRQEG